MGYMKYSFYAVIFFALAAVFSSAWFGVHYFDGTVVAKPYDVALAWDRALAERERHGWKMDVDFTQPLQRGQNVVDVRFVQPDGSIAPITTAQIQVVAAHRNQERQEFTVTLEEGRFRVQPEFAYPGTWQIIATLQPTTTPFTLEQNVYVME